MAKFHASQISLSTRQLCITAVMGAFVFLMTIVPRVPIPLGYAHLGDAAIFLVVLFVGRREGILAGCLGSAFADLFGGFPLWVGPTLIIKYLMADTFWYIALKNHGETRGESRTAAGLVLACFVMAVGYALFGALLYDSIAAGLSSAPGLLLEGAVNMVAFYIGRKAIGRAAF